MQTQTERDLPAPPDDPDQLSPSAGSEILAALKGKIEPVRTSLMYRLAAVLVAVAMLILPAIYFALIFLVGFGVYWHAAHDVKIFDSSAGFYVQIFLYVTPIVVGAILILFMLKPIFARPRDQVTPWLLDRTSEPLLYAFVEQLCEMVGSPKPRKIYVDCQINAAAGFSGGIMGWLLGRVDLHLGMPLILNLNMRQTASVLAHEMRHFSQGSGMRLTYIVRSANLWFFRVIYQRDNWDRFLFRLSHRRIGVIRLIGILSVLAVTLIRRILRFLLTAGHAISSFLLRQMEFDADLQAARLVGCDGFEDQVARVGPLLIAFQTTMQDLDVSWRERRLADDLPLFIRIREAALPESIRAMASQALVKRKSRWFETHPSFSDRLERVRRDNAKGIFKIGMPTAALFTDSKELSRLVTIQFYQKFFGKFLKPEHLYFTEEISAKHDVRREQHGALNRYFRGLLNPTRPIFPEQGLILPEDADQRATNIMSARSNLLDRSVAAQAAAKFFGDADATISRIVRARTLQSAGVNFKPAKLHFVTADPAELDALDRQSRAAIQDARRVLDPILREQLRRMQTALSPTAPIPAPGNIPDDPDLTGEIQLAQQQTSPEERIRDAFRVLSQTADGVERLRWRFTELDTLVPLIRREGNPTTLVRQILASSKVTYDTLVDVHRILLTAPYPYEHTQNRASISSFCCAKLPSPKNVRSVHLATKVTLTGVYGLYMRLLADMAERAEKAEQSLGLLPLDPPQAALAK